MKKRTVRIAGVFFALLSVGVAIVTAHGNGISSETDLFDSMIEYCNSVMDSMFGYNDPTSNSNENLDAMTHTCASMMESEMNMGSTMMHNGYIGM
ncbi:MAG: hypothetical protein ACE5KT_04640 [Methanosarcinales archaeon]